MIFRACSEFPVRLSRPLAALLLGGMLLLAAACGGEVEESPFGEEALGRLSVREKVGQLVVARVVVPAAGDTAALRTVREAGVGGVLLAGGDAGEEAPLTD